MRREFPNTISKLSKLTSLTLENLGFVTIESSLTLMYDLNYLNMSGNKLSSFPRELSQLKNLNNVVLDANPISVIDPVVLDMNESVNISLANTQIQTIDQAILNKLKPITFGLESTPFGEWLGTEKGEKFRNYYDEKQIYFQPYSDPGGC
jgi:Leucine-rich repeat (LRR) protein